MSSCQDGCDLTPNQETVVDNESTCGQNDFYQLPSVTVRDARTLSISSATSKTSDCRNSSSESYSPFGSPESSPNSSLRSSSSSSSDMMELGRRGSNRSSPTNMGDKGRSEVHLELDALESGVSQMRDKFEDLSSNNNNLHFSSPTKDKLRYNRRSLVRSSSSACSSISENMEDACSSEESDADRNSSSSSSSSSPRNKPPLQRSNAIRGDDNIQPSPRSLSPISPVEELETYSGIKTVVRRPKKSQNGGSSPSWRWSVMGVGTGDYDAVTKASYKGRHPPPVSTSTPTGSSNHGNGHASVLRRGSVGLSSTSTLVSPRSNKLSTEFRRLSLQMDMPWRVFHGGSLKMELNSTMQVLIIQTGGTIDKAYPKRKGGYAFEIGESAARGILEQHKVPLRFRYETVCQKDSQDISDEDRLNLLTVCNDCSEKLILITHGTDTLLSTASFLGHQNLPKRIVLTGALLPEKFKDSDAAFNIGMALGALQCLPSNGIYVTLNGLVMPWRQAMRDPDTGQYVPK